TDAGTSCRIRLKNIDRTRLEHVFEVRRIETVLPGSYRHSRRRAVSNQTQTWQVVRRDWFLEPAHVMIRESLGKFQSLLAIVSPIRIDEKIRGGADSSSCRCNAARIPRRI